MSTQHRKKDYRFKKLAGPFYGTLIFMFFMIGTMSFIACLVAGFTNQRVVVSLLNFWFMLMTMDMVTIRFKRENERTFWHDWVFFNRKSKILQKYVEFNNKQKTQNQESNPQNQQDLNQDSANDIKKAG